jgi:tetratricopeptide (TPR) repeat protein
MVVGGYVAVSLIWVPAKLGAGVAFERGQRAEAAGEFARAAAYYDAALEGVPDSTAALARSAITHWHAGEHTQALRSLQQLQDRPLPDEVGDELVDLLEQMTGGTSKPGVR